MTIKRYAATGVSRIVIMAAEAAARDGVAVVRWLAAIVEAARTAG